jgi:predicted 3-demethylubiquinone-9 3-methyltransferase (glyoxalase superfamily)
MDTRFQRISAFLSFEREAEEAASFYTGIFPNSRITTVTRYGKDLAKMSGQREGSVMTVAFELDGQPFVALNGGPARQFGPSMSLVVNCADQREVDHYWDALSAGGQPIQCGWLTDRYGITWQVVPSVVWKFHAIGGKLADGMMAALVQMTKLDVAALEMAARKNA